MLSALTSQLGALSLRVPTAAGALALKAGVSASSARLCFSTSAPAAEEAAGDAEDATSAFLSASAPTAARSVKTMKKNIRVSPRKLTYLAQQIRGLSAEEAILQLKFSPKRRAEVVKKTVQNAINLADIQYQIEPENLQVAECFVNKGHYLKRLRIMGRGRSGVMHHPHTHLTVVLREIDSSKKKLNRFQTKKLAREAAQAAQAAQATEATQN